MRYEDVHLFLLNHPGATFPELRDAVPGVTAQELYRLHKRGKILQKGAYRHYEYYPVCSVKLKENVL